MHVKHPYALCGQCRPWSACTNVQADQGLHCPLPESMDTVVYIDKRRMSRSDCMDANAHLDLRCLHSTQEPFYHVAHHMNFYIYPKYWDTLTTYLTSPKIWMSVLLHAVVLKTAGLKANSGDLQQMQHSVASFLGLLCLLRLVCTIIWINAAGLMGKSELWRNCRPICYGSCGFYQYTRFLYMYISSKYFCIWSTRVGFLSIQTLLTFALLTSN